MLGDWIVKVAGRVTSRVADVRMDEVDEASSPAGYAVPAFNGLSADLRSGRAVGELSLLCTGDSDVVLCQEVEYLGYGIFYAVCNKLEEIILDLVEWVWWVGWRGRCGSGWGRRKMRWSWRRESSRWRLRLDVGGSHAGTNEGIVVSLDAQAAAGSMHPLQAGGALEKMATIMRLCGRRRNKARGLSLDIAPIRAAGEL